MQVTHLGHASVLVEAGSTRILIDPGGLSDGWHGLTDLDAVFVTHQHPDHLDPANLPDLLKANPGARLLVEPSVVGFAPVTAEATPLAADETTTIGDLSIAGVGGQHAEIHPDLPRIGNLGLVIRAEGEPTLFHPGDSYETAPEGVDVLALPLNAPWGKAAEAVDFVRRVGAERTFPIHDAFLTPTGRSLYLMVVGNLTQTELIDLEGHRTAQL